MLVILKIGGSSITDKMQEAKLKKANLSRIVAEIVAAKKEAGFQLLVVHGVGPFGHIPAKKYGLKDGFHSEEQKLGLAETHWLVSELNQAVCDAFVKQGVPALGVHPLEVINHDKKRINHFDTGVVRKMLDAGFVPVIFGDVVFDDSLNSSICSGDQSLAYLVNELKPELVVLGTDVDGVFTADPKTNPDAKLIKEVTKANLETVISSLEEAKTHDVTGGMKGKVNELLGLAVGGKLLIINALKKGRFHDALVGKKVKGTSFRV